MGVKLLPATIEAKGVHVVTVKGTRYCYAWRGGPRLSSFPGDAGFDEEYRRVWQSTRTTGGKRKLVLSGSKKASNTLEQALLVALENAKQRAARKGARFDLTKDQLVDLLEAAGGRCALSGLPFDPRFDPEAKFAHNPYGISIDRIVPAGGYTLGNVRLVLTALNFAINQWGFDAYLQIARATLARNPA